MDPSVGEVPETMSSGLVAATPTCVAVGTLSELDGATRISLDYRADLSGDGAPCFDGVLETPGRKVAVCSVLDEVLLEISVGTARTHVRIWANDPAEPSELRISAAPSAG
jgi:hypothetical protein